MRWSLWVPSNSECSMKSMYVCMTTNIKPEKKGGKSWTQIRTVSLQLYFPATFLTSHKRNSSFFPKKHTGLQTGISCFIQWAWVAKRNWIISKCDRLETKYTMWHTSATWEFVVLWSFYCCGFWLSAWHMKWQKDRSSIGPDQQEPFRLHSHTQSCKPRTKMNVWEEERFST